MGLHRDPQIWGLDSMLFNPRRWTQGSEEQAKLIKLQRRAFMAFGSRPHLCPAKEVAPFMIAILVAALITQIHGQFELVDQLEGGGLAGNAPMDLGRDAYGGLRLRKII
jgi:cytochrome P450